jgi:hypothetical protein
MKDAKKGEQKKEIEFTNDHSKDSLKKSYNNEYSASFFASALAQGIVPRVVNKELFRGLSLLGNHNFIQALEQKEARNKALKNYIERDTFDTVEVSNLKESLADNFNQSEVNTIEIIRPKSSWTEVPDSVTDETIHLSTLTPIDFSESVPVGSGGPEGQYTGDMGITVQEIINE